MIHLACQKNLATSKLSGNGRKDPNLPLPLSFGVSKFFLTSQMHHRKRTIFFYCIWLAQKILETPKLSGNGRLGSFCQNFFWQTKNGSIVGYSWSISIAGQLTPGKVA
ncbi:unnamed protein product [Blepharisma stoltei]|uniref:Uncharacterized protein n=1 Tax=Blepharisma stoltei TaxID=1481888 RepID=A0AAU9IZ11_9CILI|nr:unnamed protein product [Blepharisma stoltei]